MRRLSSAIWLSAAVAMAALPIPSRAQVICVSNNVPPPELPVYDQPPIPAPGYIWTPGYWAGGPNGYFWVPGTWVLPPATGLLWTPGYWAWRDGIYTWTAGYWGPQIGFYGGVDYGFGYTGEGYEGGHWDHGVFAYNRAVNNFGNVTITHVYEKIVVVDRNAPRTSFNGGSGGTTARPTPQEEAAAREQHVAAIAAQSQQERLASSNKALLASENHGQPAIAATAKPGEFSGQGVVAAREAKTPSTLEQPRPNGPAATGTGPAISKTLESKPSENEQRPGEANLNGATPPKPGFESKPLDTHVNPANTEAKAPAVEGKPAEKPLTTESKPPNREANVPNTEHKQPPVSAPPKLGPQPHIAVTPPPHPAPAPSHPAVTPHPAAATAHPTDKTNEKKPPG